MASNGWFYGFPARHGSSPIARWMAGESHGWWLGGTPMTLESSIWWFSKSWGSPSHHPCLESRWDFSTMNQRFCGTPICGNLHIIWFIEAKSSRWLSPGPGSGDEERASEESLGLATQQGHGQLWSAGSTTRLQSLSGKDRLSLVIFVYQRVLKQCNEYQLDQVYFLRFWRTLWPWHGGSCPGKGACNAQIQALCPSNLKTLSFQPPLFCGSATILFFKGFDGRSSFKS